MRTRIDAPVETVFAWHTRPGALERLIPPWDRMRVVRRRGHLGDGGEATVRARVAGVPITWVAEHRDFVENERFTDVQVKGPFAHWSHTHRFEPTTDGACEMIDEIEYRLPGGALGEWLAGRAVQRKLERTFRYRHALVANDIALHRREAPGRALTVAISGSRGLIGSALTLLLSTGGHTVKRIVRGESMHEGQIGWSPATGEVEAAKLEGVDAVVHLAGEPIMGRWTAAKKGRIYESRVDGTRRLAEALAKLERRPAVLVNASAIGYYGHRGDELITEESEPGNDFLARTCVDWEAATQPAADAGIRVAKMRTGVVLSPEGGALGSMLPAFRLGLGGTLGKGDAWWSWITRDDLIGAIYHAICNEKVSGAVNAVGPAPVTNRTFTKVLGRVLRRPTLLPVPRFAARLALGELADAALFASVRAQPWMLESTGYAFRDPELAPALERVLGRA